MVSDILRVKGRSQVQALSHIALQSFEVRPE
jgi:hypothetical protein